MNIISNVYWLYYLADGYLSVDDNSAEERIGKWMFFFDIAYIEQIEEICMKAVEEGVTRVCKHSNPDGTELRPYDNSQGVACFYCDYYDEEAHKRILGYFIKNNLIRKTKTGKLYNISFKLDEQTENGQYGKLFKGTIKLDRFVDLATGEFK